jgi:hypothetical protein
MPGSHAGQPGASTDVIAGGRFQERSDRVLKVAPVARPALNRVVVRQPADLPEVLADRADEAQGCAVNDHVGSNTLRLLTGSFDCDDASE